MTTPKKIFISYARKDGKDDADKLRQRLIIEGFEVWQDLVAMNIGENWQRQLFEAIEQADALIMILTPAALTSTMARQEWVHARRVGTPIFPVAFTDIYKLDNVPRWVNKVDAVILDTSFVGVDDKWQTLVKQLRNSTLPPRVPNMITKLQPEYVERKELYQAIIADLLDADGASPKPATHYTVLLGEGGFGKTTLAEAVGLDIAINEAYTGGIFFVTIGESGAQLNEKWHSILQAIGDEGRYAEPINQLKIKLKGDDFLIILDDVWDRSHIDPILRLEGCNYLITTRDETIATISRNKESIHLIKEMTSDEAREVLLKYISINKRKEIEKDKALINDIHELGVQLGEWALLLDIHGSTIRQECLRGYSVREALDYVLEGLHEEGLVPIPKGTDGDTRRRTLHGSMNASLRRYIEDEKQRIYELSIFPDDTAIPEVVVAHLWMATAQMSKYRCKDLLRRVAGHFCRFRAEHEDEIPVVSFHDKIRDYLGGQLTNISDIHAQFLDGYGISNWSKIPQDEQYLWRNIAYHLFYADRHSELRQLLLEYSFLQAKLGATDVNALIVDCGYLSADPTIQLIKSALNMSAHILDRDKSALAHQLAGRLMRYYRQSNEIKIFWDKIIPPSNSLFPMMSDYDHLNPAGGMLLRTMKHDDSVNGVLVLRDGRILSWSSNESEQSKDNTLRLWDSNGNAIATFKGHESIVRGAHVLSDGRILSWSNDKTLRLWDSNGNLLNTLTGHTDKVIDAYILKDGQILSQSRDRTLRLWDNEGNSLAILEGHTDMIMGIDMFKDGQILSWSNDKTLRIWDSDGSLLNTLNNHTNKITDAYIFDDERILSWGLDKTLHLWSREGNLLAIFTGHAGRVTGAQVLTDGRILSWSDDKTLRLWSNTGNLLITFTGHTGKVTGAQVLTDGRILSWSTDTTLRLWNNAGKLLTTLTGHTEKVNGAQVLTDGQILSWSDDTTLRLWNSMGNPLTTLIKHTRAVNGTQLLIDKRILSWSDDRTLCLWNSAGKLLITLTGHTGKVTGAQVLADGRILSWSNDATLRLWSSLGNPLTILTGHTGRVTSAHILADGRILSLGGDLHLWDSEGNLIDKIKTNNHGVVDRQQGIEWATKHKLTLKDIYPPPPKPHYHTSGKRIHIRIEGANLVIYDKKINSPISTFYGDAPFTYPAILSNRNIIVVGDSVGRVVFLYWVKN